MRRRTRARAWLAAIVAATTACALPIAQARAASCKRAAVLVSGGLVSSATASDRTEAADAADAPREAGAPIGDDAQARCPSALAIGIAPTVIAPASCGHLAELARDSRAPPRSIASGLERPPRRA